MQRTLFRSVQHTRLAMLAGVVLVLSQTGLASTNTSLSMMETPLQVLQQPLLQQQHLQKTDVSKHLHLQRK